MKQFYFLVVANVKEMTRDWMQLLWFLCFPIVFSLIFGVVFANVGAPATDDVGLAGADPIGRIMPGILAMTLMQLGLFGSLRIANLRERSTLKLLGATMLPRSLFLASEVTVRIGMSVVQALMIIAIGTLVFGMRIAGHWYSILAWVILGAGTFVALGYALVSQAKTADSANGLIQVVQFTMMFLSGIFIPMEQMPVFLHPVVKAIPLTYLADGMRSVMSGTAPMFGLLVDSAVLAGVLILSLVGASRFRWGN